MAPGSDQAQEAAGTTPAEAKPEGQATMPAPTVSALSRFLPESIVTTVTKAIESAFVNAAPAADAKPYFPKVGDKPIKAKDAQTVFDHMSAMTDIAFGYANDGCYARAHLMCDRLFDMGHTPGKAWAFEDEKGSLTVNAPDGKTIRWWYHVAPTLPVEMPDGSVQKMVFDPSLFDGPVTKQAWGDIMKANPAKVSFRPCGEPAPEYTGDYTPYQKTTLQTKVDAVDTMKGYLPLQGTGPRSVFPCRFGECLETKEPEKLMAKNPPPSTQPSQQPRVGA